MENVQLTEGFFQDFFEGSSTDSQPVLQVVKARMQDNGIVSCRLQLSDGFFQSSSCGAASKLKERIDADGICQPERYAVIKLTDFTPNVTGVKTTFMVNDYELVAIDVPKMGNPTNHTGDPDAFRGVMSAKKRLLNDNTVAAMPTVNNSPAPRKVPNRQEIGIIPVAGLSPFVNGKWKISGVVTSREPLKEIMPKSGKGPMKIFSFVITDRDGDSIKLTSFGEVSEKLSQRIHENKGYYFGGTSRDIRNANSRFNSTGHAYEVNLNSDQDIIDMEESHMVVPKFSLKPIAFSDIANFNGQAVDVLALVDRLEDPVTISTKDGRSLRKRDIPLLDSASTACNLTIWGDMIDNLNVEVGTVIGIKGAFVREFQGGYSLSVNNGSRIELNPDCEMSTKLAKWYETERSTLEIKSVSTTSGGGSASASPEEFRLLPVVSGSDLPRMFAKGVYFNTTGIISAIRSDSAVYKACSGEKCLKKVVEVDGSYRCEKCNITSDKFKYRYTLNMEVADATGSTWVSLFDDRASALLGKSADEVGSLQETDKEGFDKVFNSVLFKPYQFRMRAQEESYNDVTRVRFNAYDCRPVDYKMYGSLLDESIERLEAL